MKEQGLEAVLSSTPRNFRDDIQCYEASYIASNPEITVTQTRHNESSRSRLKEGRR